MWFDLGRPLRPRLQRQRISVNVKVGRRKWLNFGELLASLASEFASQSEVLVNDPTVLSFTQEVALLQVRSVFYGMVPIA